MPEDIMSYTVFERFLFWTEFGVGGQVVSYIIVGLISVVLCRLIEVKDESINN